MTPGEVQRLVHELQVHQIELLVQNDDLRRTEAELAKIRDQYFELFELAPVGYLTIGPKYRIERCNLSAAELLGLERSKVEGAVLAALIAPEDRDSCFLAMRETLESGARQTCKCAIVRTSGPKRYVQLSIVPVNEQSPANGCRVTLNDITKQQEAEDDLRTARDALEQRVAERTAELTKANELLRSAMQQRQIAEASLQDERRRLADIITADHAGTWEWNVQTGETIFNQRWAEIVGYTLEELAPLSIETWNRLVHPDDRRASVTMLERLFRREIDYYDIESRLKHKDGSWVWVRDRGQVITWTGKGKPVWMRGTHHDVTQQKCTETALRASESRFRAYVDQAADALFVQDFAGRFLDVNPRACTSLGYSRDELLQMSLSDVETEFDLVNDQNSTPPMTPETPRTVTGRHRRKDGSTFPVEVRISCFDLEEQRYYLCLARDITDRKSAELALLRSNERLELAKQAAGQGVWDWNIPTGKLDWSPEIYTLLGLAPGAHAPSLTAWDAVMHPDDRAAMREYLERALRDRDLREIEFRAVHPEGNVRWIRAMSQTTSDDAGQAIRMTGICMDITEHRQLLDKIRQWNTELERTVASRTAELTAAQGRTAQALAQVAASESRFRSMFEQAPLGVALIDSLTGQIHEVNLRFAEIAGRTREEMATIDWMSITHPDDVQAGVDNMARMNAGEIPGFQMNKRFIRPDGSLVWISMTIAPVNDRDVPNPRHLCMIEDITLRKFAEEQLRSITDAANDAILMMDPRGAISYWNPAAERILGYTAKEALGRNLHELLAPERYRADQRAAFSKFVRTGTGNAVGRTLELIARRRDGREIPVSLSLSGVWLHEAWHAVGIVSDITERKQAEERLRDALQRLELATAAGGIGTWTWTFDGDKLEWDDRLQEWYGVPDEVRDAGVSVEFWRSRVHPDDRNRVESELNESRRHGAASEDTYRVVLPDGQLRYLHSAWTFQRDRSGNLVRAIGVKQDITSQHILEEKLRNAKKEADAANAAKSEFLANMSHEIRTPMNGVIGMTGLLLDTELNQQQQRYAEIVRASGESLLTLINDILDFSKIEAGKLELETIDFDLRDMLNEFAAPLALRAQDKGIELICAAAPNLPARMCGDPGRLRQILTNLASNAVKFTQHGEVSILASLVSESEASIMLRFSVRDSGIGISPEQQERLFQKFTQADASTTRRFGGTGLGLSIAKQLVELMGGQIGMSSEAGVGSEFWFTARLEKSPRIDVAAAPPADLLGLRILVVEDSDARRKILAAQLIAWGMQAEAVSDGSAALRSLARACDEKFPFRAALIDMRMPDMDGNALAQAIRGDASFGSIPLIQLTDLNRQCSAEDLAKQGFAACLTKPVRPADLLDCLCHVLADQPALRPAGGRSERKSPPAPRRTNARILVAEDNIVNQEVALGILRKLGLQASVVENGAEVIDKLQGDHYDLVLMDVEMPEMDGLEATCRIRDPQSDVLDHQIPIIAMTAAAMQGDRDRCLASGMNGYVTKPISPQALSEVLNTWLPPGHPNS